MALVPCCLGLCPSAPGAGLAPDMFIQRVAPGAIRGLPALLRVERHGSLPRQLTKRESVEDVEQTMKHWTSHSACRGLWPGWTKGDIRLKSEAWPCGHQEQNKSQGVRNGDTALPHRLWRAGQHGQGPPKSPLIKATGKQGPGQRGAVMCEGGRDPVHSSISGDGPGHQSGLLSVVSPWDRLSVAAWGVLNLTQDRRSTSLAPSPQPLTTLSFCSLAREDPRRQSLLAHVPSTLQLTPARAPSLVGPRLRVRVRVRG